MYGNGEDSKRSKEKYIKNQNKDDSKKEAKEKKNLCILKNLYIFLEQK